MAAVALARFREDYDGRRSQVSEAIRQRAIEKQKAAVLRLQALQAARRVEQSCGKVEGAVSLPSKSDEHDTSETHAGPCAKS
eukprot:Skav227902  [mRNA]  locus=scaffold146:14674:16273:+ [translate_table: standard]